MIAVFMLTLCVLYLWVMGMMQKATSVKKMGATMNLNLAPEQISEADYLQCELLAETKHEYIDGQVHAMAGASENHNLLSVNILTELKTRLKGTPCRTFIAVKLDPTFFIRT